MDGAGGGSGGRAAGGGRAPLTTRGPSAGAVERVSRERLELVIRRAAELYAREADTGDLLTEEEVLRIAEELGLPPRLARQALYEVPSADVEADEGVSRRLLGDAAVVAARAIAAPERSVAAAIQEHLIRREYMSVVRNRQGRMKLAPASDVASAIARSFKRSGKRYLIARSEEVDVSVRALDPTTSHVVVDVDLANKRGEHLAGGVLGGAAIGATVGGAAFAGVAAALGGIGAPEALALASGAGLIGLAAGVGTGLKMAASSFRKRLQVARTEIEGLLDRVEAAASGSRLPPAR
ncbi:MAG TPA: hypothetical protein VK837_03025 [Longimicrobiales bacterium]|nr:hypothetical protein [Longimicrobiales bacterium]